MNLVTVRELRSHPAKVWKDLDEKGDLVLTNNGRPVAILSPTEEGTVEEKLRHLSRLRAMEAVERIQRASVRAGLDTMDLEAIHKVIRKARRGAHP